MINWFRKRNKKKLLREFLREVKFWQRGDSITTYIDDMMTGLWKEDTDCEFEGFSTDGTIKLKWYDETIYRNVEDYYFVNESLEQRKLDYRYSNEMKKNMDTILEFQKVYEELER